MVGAQSASCWCSGRTSLRLGRVALVNFVAGAAGPTVFFCLPGFLTVTFLHQALPIGEIRKAPCADRAPAWLAMMVLFFQREASKEQITREMLFAATLHQRICYHCGHLCLLCVEMLFYLDAALLALLGERQGNAPLLSGSDRADSR